MLIPLRKRLAINRKLILSIIWVILSLLCLLVCFINIPAQYRFDTWTTDNGLPQNSVQDILQSQDGYLWLITNGGIVRFDGIRFKVFNKSNTKGLIDSRYTMMLEDGGGRLWFLTEENTIVKYENGNFTTFNPKSGKPGKIIYRFYKDQNGILTFTTEEGHFRYQDGIFEKFEIPTSLAKTYICYIDKKGGFWLTESLASKTEKHNIRRVLGDQVTYFDFETKGDSMPPFIYEDRFNNFWVSIAAGSLNRIYNEKTQLIPIDVGFYTDFLEDLDGNLWLGQKNGLSMIEADEVGKENLDISKIRSIPQNGEIWNDQIKSLATDHEKGIWVGTYKSGLHHLTPQTIRVYSKTDWKTEAENVYPIFEDSESNVWVGVWTATLIKYDRGNNFKAFVKTPFDVSLSSFFEDSNKRIWLGGRKFVGYFENNEFVVFDKFTDWGELYVNAITEDKNGGIWFGSAAKLVRYADNQIKVFTTADGLPDKFITALLTTKDGKLWVGTKRGLAVFENEKFTTFTNQDDLNSDYVRSLSEDTDGNLWIGTYDTGLILYKNGKFTRITEKDGMFNGNVFCTLEDDNGWFWINSNQGIYRVKKQQLNDFADGKIKKIDSIAYNKNDGLLNTEGNGGFQPAGIRRKNG
ncbi:MAG TPA: two-component regulator propeller domain-containing protein, partial [Pyrinomonadaceae bacterium]|nr:two-component regulator propeller domain-containing protein [Pyrinomonadaceae bacterium]